MYNSRELVVCNILLPDFFTGLKSILNIQVFKCNNN